ncbi:hypothetical protein [Streptomyces misionensis]|uniref:hypothetical protein n=1 Tax=Streptomyces misionensis TaxID=67331 RepID=UPI00396BD74D
MTAKTPAELSDSAAESVRSLNHATLQQSSNGWQYPGDAYSVVGNLAHMAGMLPQAIGQLESLIGSLEDGGNLRSDQGPEDLPGRLIEFHGAIADAIGQAHALQRALDRAHQALGAIAYEE